MEDENYLSEILRMNDEGCPHYENEDCNKDSERLSDDSDYHGVDRNEYYEDSILERQEMEDFEQVDEYYTLDFGYQDYPDYGDY